MLFAKKVEGCGPFMNSDEKLQKKIAYYKNKQEKEETYIATHTENLEKIKTVIAELENKKDAAVIKKILTITREKGLDIDKVVDEFFDSLTEKRKVPNPENDIADKKLNPEQNDISRDLKENTTEEKYEKFVPHVPDVFK